MARSPAPLRDACHRRWQDLRVTAPDDALVLRDDDGYSTLVIEDGVFPRRVRRPTDLLRIVLALVAGAVLVALAYFLTATTAGIESDITGAGNRLPGFIVAIVNLVAGFGVLLLPIVAGIDLLVRKRGRQLLEALGALFVAVAVAILLSALLITHGSPRLVVAITGAAASEQRSAFNAIVAGLVAFITVSRLIGRGRWTIASALTVSAIAVGAVTSGTWTATSIGLSLLLGWVIGLAVRYILGTATTRPSGLAVASTLERGGFPVSLLRAAKTTARGRQYDAHTTQDEHLRVVVFDRDLEGAGLAAALWNQIRLRTDPTNAGFSMRAQIDHSALMSYAAHSAGAPVPELRLATEVGPDASLLAFEELEGSSFAEAEPGTITDNDLVGIARAVRILHADHIAHRSLSPDHMVKDSDGKLWLTGMQYGQIAAGDVENRIDLAEMLCSFALLTDPDRAVAAAVRVFGADETARALPALQLIALSPDTRKRMRKNKEVLAKLRDAVIELRPSAAEVQPLELRRIKPRTLLTLVAGTIAAYVLFTQLANVNIIDLLRSANWTWALVALVFSFLTIVGASLTLSGFVPEQLKHIRTFMAQLAASFATLVSPPTLGSLAINVRYLQKAGLHPALASASVGVSQVFAFFIHIALLFVTGIAAGHAMEHSVTPPKWAIIAIVVLLGVLGLLLLVPAVRKLIRERVQPILAEVGPRLLTIAQRPIKLAEGIGGILLLNGAFAACMIACCEAFGAGSANYAAIALVYLAGSTIGQAAPTPGGLGAVEAAYVAGLTAAGLDPGIALSATLLFRLLTFWLPTIPGYWAFNRLQKIGAL